MKEDIAYALSNQRYGFNDTFPVMFLDEHVKLVKHTGLVSFGSWIYIFIAAVAEEEVRDGLIVFICTTSTV